MKTWFLKGKGFVVLLVLILVVTGCTPPAETKSLEVTEVKTEVSEVDSGLGEVAYGYLQALAQVGPRLAGTDSEVATADWLVAELTRMGYEVTRLPFAYEDDGNQTSENIMVEKKGTGQQSVIIGAHYDSVDVGMGVDDNASGVAVVLAAAKAFKDIETPHTLKFVFFGAEEVGLHGSTFFAEGLSEEDVAETVAMINFDSLVAGDYAYVYGSSDEKGWLREFALEKAVALNLALITQEGLNPDLPYGTTGDWSDHAPFKDRGIAILYFESTNWLLGAMDGYTQVDEKLGENGEVWHTAFDTLTYLEETFPGRVQERLSLYTSVLKVLLMEELVFEQ